MDKRCEQNNPYGLCNLKADVNCRECSLTNELDCHFDLKKLFHFMASFLLIVVAGSVGLAVNGLMKELYTFLIVFGIFSIIFFEFWEIRILCSHCPFYAENKKTLHCSANYGSLKVWKYHPGPMSTSEKVQLMIGFTILTAILLMPTAYLTIHGYYLWAVLPVIALAVFGYVLKRLHCCRCVNFSCPFNTVPGDIVNDFIECNPVIKKAWYGE